MVWRNRIRGRIMRLFCIFLFFIPLLSEDETGITTGLVYPEVRKMQYLDPYIYKFDSEILPDFDDEESKLNALTRFSALFHETFIETGKKENSINFITERCDGESDDCTNSFVIDTSPDGNKTYTELTIKIDPNKQYWKFHNDEKVTVEDIYYSLRYATLTKTNIPELYESDRIRISKPKQGSNELKILYKFNVARPVIVRQLKKLIVLPSKSIKKFVDSNADYQNNRSGYDELRDLYVPDRKANPNSIHDIKSAGPFEIAPNQYGDITLRRFENYGPRFRNSADMKTIRIKTNPNRGEWHSLVLGGKNLNLAINPSNTKTNDVVSVRRISGFKVTSLIVNHNNKYLQDRLFRESISVLFDKRELLSENMEGGGRVIHGPYPKKHDKYKHFQVRHNKIKFHENMEKLGYKRDGLSYYNDKDGKRITIEILYQANDDKVRTLINEFKRVAKNEGIYIDPIEVTTNSSLKNKIDSKAFDLYFNTSTIKFKSNLALYYSENGEKNYGDYKPSVQLNEKILEIEEICGKGLTNDCNEDAKYIWTMLAQDYANIYLWSPFEYYAYNKQKLPSFPWSLVNSESFFTSPHDWELFKKD